MMAPQQTLTTAVEWGLGILVLVLLVCAATSYGRAMQAMNKADYQEGAEGFRAAFWSLAFMLAATDLWDWWRGAS